MGNGKCLVCLSSKYKNNCKVLSTIISAIINSSIFSIISTHHNHKINNVENATTIKTCIFTACFAKIRDRASI